MTLNIKHAESLSRGELLLRSFFGIIYMTLPHMFVLLFVGLWGSILGFIAWWMILFTGRYPQSFFEFQVGLIRWQTRLNARMLNLADGYPAFGISATDDATEVTIPYPESLSRGTLLLKTFFGFFYVLLPHGFCLIFIGLGVYIAAFIGWWAILFTGRLPKGIHDFITGYFRWNLRVNLYFPNYMTDTYPPFSLD